MYEYVEMGSCWFLLLDSSDTNLEKKQHLVPLELAPAAAVTSAQIRPEQIQRMRAATVIASDHAQAMGARYRAATAMGTEIHPQARCSHLVVWSGLFLNPTLFRANSPKVRAADSIRA